ncbi:MAG: ParB/RepB/Spo0J family partition protein [Clostridia bacterium]|nr:ParB/RepB/Spo0J family partition protein [Clostridia bacterium]
MKNQTKIEEVAHIDISLIDDFEGHPFTVKDDESMEELARSIEENGILNPIIVRKKEGGRYEIVAGHRRKSACLLLGIKEIPVIIRELNREEAVIEMVDSNFQREHILPSEKAKAYKMKMDSIKRKAGRPRKENVSPPGTRVRTDEIIAREVGESRNQIQRYIRLNELTPELLEFVDEGKIGLRPAVEISFLTEDEQRDLVDFIDAEGVFPSHAQTIRMKELSRAGRLNTSVINRIMREQKGNQKEKISVPVERLKKYFPRGASPKQMEETIIKALEFYRKRKREDREER